MVQPAPGPSTLLPTMLNGILTDTMDTESKMILQMLLDALIAGQQTKQNDGFLGMAADRNDLMSPDGPLTGPLAAQESAMFLSLAQLTRQG